MSDSGRARTRRGAPRARARAEGGLADGAGATPALRQVVLRSLSWVGVARAVSALGGALRYLVFARLLTPFDFGVIGAASFFEVLFQTIVNPNFERALVAEPEAVEPYLDTVWVAMLAQGGAVALTLVFLARPLAAVFHIQDSYRVFIMAAPIPVLAALKSPASTGRIYRGLDFQVSAVLNIAELMASFTVGLAGVLWWRDWRGLIAAMYAGHATRSGLTYWYYPYWPRLRFEMGRARRMFAYGRWIAVRGVAEFAARNLDNLAVGHLLGPRALGEYQMAFRIGELPPTELANGIGMVSFPVAARLQAEPATLDRLLMLTGGAVALFGIAYAALMFGSGDRVISATIGAQWLGALAPLRLLCVYGMLQGVTNVGASFLDGLGRPAFSFQLTLIDACALAVLIYPLTAVLGTSGAALAIVVSAVIPMPRMLKLYRRASGVRGTRA